MAASDPPEAPAGEPVVPRPAATIIVVRDQVGDQAADHRGDQVRDQTGDRTAAVGRQPAPAGAEGAGGLQVLMVRRNLRSDFIGGAYVFPGGAVEPTDAAPAARACCAGRTDAEASALLGLGAGGLAYWVAALRECFEEAGLLLAVPAGPSSHGAGPGEVPDRHRPPAATGPSGLLSLEEPVARARFHRHRAAVNAAEREFVDVCREERLQLAVDQVHYFAHWITPQGAPRRYDTRFFVARAPEGQLAVHDAGETIAEEWVAPADALRRHREGEIELLLPTVRNLQAIARFDRVDALVDAARAAAGQVPTTEPRVVVDGGGARILLPGDDGYEEARPLPGPIGAAAPGGTAMQDAVRRISRAANS